MIKIKEIFNKIKNSDFFKTYKEEIIAIPLLILCFYLFNYICKMVFPDGNFYDFIGQIENLFYKAVTFIVSIFFAHIMIRVSFPNIYKHIHNYIYNFNIEKKNDYAVYILIAFIIAAALIFS